MGAPIRRVAVVGNGDRAETLTETARTAGARVVTDGDASGEPDVTIAVGADAIRTTVADAPDASVLPVGDHRFAFGTDTAVGVIRKLVGATEPSIDGMDDVRRVTHAVLAVDAGRGTTHRAIADVALVTAQPAQISEFGIGDQDRREASFRGDGVVVATPFGSDGYANAAGGPVVEPGAGLAVVPVAPFSTRAGPRIVDGGVSLSVERDEVSVSLVIDGAACGVVDPHRPVAIETVARVAALAPATTASWARRSETL